MGEKIAVDITAVKLFKTALILIMVFQAPPVVSDNSITDAIANGELHFSLRYRYEHVDDNRLSGAGAPLKNSNASTLRTFLGYKTGAFHDLSVTLDLENVTKAGGGDFNDGSNGKTDFATVVDPSGTEVDQAFLSYTGIRDTRLELGRQYITYRKAPFHRYIGTILWRQNWQTFDAFTINNQTLPNTRINYAYTWNINRIFGEDAPEPLSHFDSDSHLINIQYSGLSLGNLEVYGYLLDFDNATGFSTQTYGVRFHGKRKLAENIHGLYVAEYAAQSDYAGNTLDIDADYFLGEIGAGFQLGEFIDSVTLKFSYERLSGKGGADRFVTISGTNHAFQGWNDRFLVTPGDGIEDFSFAAVMLIKGASLIAAYHDIGSDNMSYDYGSELNLLLSKTVKKRYTLGLKYAAYDADKNTSNLGRNGVNAGTGNDVDKFWVWAQYKY